MARIYGVKDKRIITFVDRKMKILGWFTSFSSDYYRYSGLDFTKAVAIDFGIPIAFNLGARAGSVARFWKYTHNVPMSLIGAFVFGTTVNTISDKTTQHLKELYTKTDKEKKKSAIL